MTQQVEGIVTPSLEIVVSIHVGGPAGQIRVIDAVVDTGFVGFLALPSMMAEELSLPYHDADPVTMADGRVEHVARHRAVLLWAGEPMLVRAHLLDIELALIGVNLLQGYNLNVDFVEGGRVSIQPVGQNS